MIASMTDAEALYRFERLVATQTPAQAPWTPVTDYSFEARKQIEGEHPRLIVQTFGAAAQDFCDVGAGFGHLERLIRDAGGGGSDYCSVDAIPQMIWASETATVYRADVASNQFLTQVIAAPFDLVICREVLEHLTIRQIRQAVTNLCALSSRFVYVTTRFAQAPQHLLDVDTSDDLDPTHITMLNQSFLRLLFVLEGFGRRADLEEKLDWQHKGRVLVYERA